MNEEMFEAELLYESSLSIAKTLLEKGLLTEEEYRVIDTKLQEKYRPVIGTLFSENDLINRG